MSSVIPIDSLRRATRAPKPEWLKVRAPGSDNYLRLRSLMRGLGLNTVCEEARCPNIGECWHHGTATFMILGDVCTRACGYCAVSHGKPPIYDVDEPQRVARAVSTLGLSYVVITSVDRDDLQDGGGFIFAETIRLIRSSSPGIRIEVLIPDFQGKAAPLEAVLDAGPDVLNHNTETVPRLYRLARSGGRYPRTLELLDRARRYAPRVPTKTGVMVGLGEEKDELLRTFRDLRGVGVEILTIGQYLRPSEQHLPMTRVLHAGGVRGAQDGGARARLRSRRVRPSRAQLLSRARTGRLIGPRTTVAPHQPRNHEPRIRNREPIGRSWQV